MEEKLTSGAQRRIPREHLHHQDERLTSKHIQTLGFLQEIVNENKSLKQRVDELENDLAECQDVQSFAKESKDKIQEIQDSYLARADEINHMLSEKHRIELMNIQEEKLEREREMKEQMLRMRHEIEALHAANKDLRDTADHEEESNEMKKKLKQKDENLQSALAENVQLKEEVECLREDLEVLQGKKSVDMQQLANLKSDNKRLEESLQEVQQKKNELEFQLDKAKGDLKEKNDSQEKLDLIENLRDKVKQLLLERQQGYDRESEMDKEITELQANTSTLKSMNFQLQNELEKLLSEYGHLAIEHEKLRKRCLKDKDKKTFKDFVSLKRELNNIKDENEALKTKVKSDSLVVLRDDPPLPAIAPTLPPSINKYANKNKRMLAISMGNPVTDKT